MVEGRSTEIATAVIAGLPNGQALLVQCENGATYYIGRFLKNYKGLIYVKHAYLRLSWGFLLEDKKSLAETSRTLVLNQGTTGNEEDMAAEKEAKRGLPGQLNLLKARLYYDGGDYDKAEIALRIQQPDGKWTTMEQAEYHYRLARINVEKGNNSDAEREFKIVISNYSIKSADYLPAASMYYLGQLYEMNGRKAEAKAKFNAVLNSGSHSYSSSFEQKARSGLARLTK